MPASHSFEPLPLAHHIEGKSSSICTSTQTELSTLQTFSPKLCVELLSSLTTVQLDYEFIWQKTVNGHDFGFKFRSPNDDAKLAGLYKSLTPNIVNDYEIYYDCNFYQSLISDFSHMLEQARTCIKELGDYTIFVH